MEKIRVGEGFSCESVSYRDIPGNVQRKNSSMASRQPKADHF